MSTTRINELPAAAGVASNDYLAIDNTSGVSQKITAAQLVHVDNTLSVAGRPADAKATGNAIAAESAARQSADTSLNNAISAEVTAREAADTALNGNIADLQGAIVTERLARQTADNTLTGSINTEIAAREAADTALNGSISAEATARAAADNEIKIAFALFQENIPGTVQTIAFDSVGNVQSITHMEGTTAVRTDVFTFAASTITEVRTLASGESLTIVTNTDTLETTTTYADAA